MDPGRILATVTDKTGLEHLARMVEGGWEVISTGRTAGKLGELEIPHLSVESVTGLPEMLDGRLKTLHPKIFGGILARRDVPAHMAALAEHGIKPIHILLVNLYNFAGRPSIEEIDIGGSALMRAGAKNGDSVIVIVDPRDYGPVFDEILKDGSVSVATREALVMKVFHHSAEYERAIYTWMMAQHGAGNSFLTPPPIPVH